jgi:hypothetical protein
MKTWAWRYNATNSLPRHLIEVSGQRQTPAALHLVKEPPVPIRLEAG